MERRLVNSLFILSVTVADSVPPVLVARHMYTYTPSSLPCTEDTIKLLLRATVMRGSDVLGSGTESLNQEMAGVGLPTALHAL